jgi:hypothetical protein
MPTIDTYKHLNDRDGVVIDIEDIAKQVVKMNYGVHRLLSALVRARRERAKATGELRDGERDELTEGIAALLERGLF